MMYVLLIVTAHGLVSPTASSAITVLKKIAVAGGTLTQFSHSSSETKTPMTCSVFIPPGTEYAEEIPAVYWLSGLTCTDENFSQKAGAFSHAVRHKLALIIPDTSPRGAGVDGEDDSYDLGSGAGFYIDATAAPWANNYRMFSYITAELPTVVENEFRISPTLRSICGHSMGGHGALTIAFKQPGEWASVSAFAPICNPTKCGWGGKAFGAYLRDGVAGGVGHDATELLKTHGPFPYMPHAPPGLRGCATICLTGREPAHIAPSASHSPRLSPRLWKACPLNAARACLSRATSHSPRLSPATPLNGARARPSRAT